MKKRLNKRMIRMRTSEDIQKLMTVTRQTGKSESNTGLLLLSTPFGPDTPPMVINLGDSDDVTGVFSEGENYKVWVNKRTFSMIHKLKKSDVDILEHTHPVLYNWIVNTDIQEYWTRYIHMETLISKYNKFAKEVGLNIFKRR